ncbi:MAG TPA: DUF58 domain-containing protein [Acidimicrobiia bacterium]|nr:DUF58 domain-containing protein [Acidimicrobiia bacterium]
MATSTAGPLSVDRAEQGLRRLELDVYRRLDGMLQGDHLGLVPAPGTELGESREYRVGDDVRRIDWPVTARTTVPHVRDTIADRELETWVVVDRTASLDFGTAQCEKRDIALASVAAVGFLTNRVGNRLGAVVLSSSGTTVIPARGGRNNAFALLRRIDSVPRADDSRTPAADLGDALQRAGHMARRRGRVVVVSDFLARDDWARPLRVLSARHDVLAIEVVDPRELELPPVGLVTLVDTETGRRVEVQTASEKVRARFAAAAAAQRADIAAMVKGAGAEHLVLRTDRDWLLDIVRYVDGRRRRRAGRAAPRHRLRATTPVSS